MKAKLNPRHAAIVRAARKAFESNGKVTTADLAKADEGRSRLGILSLVGRLRARGEFPWDVSRVRSKKAKLAPKAEAAPGRKMGPLSPDHRDALDRIVRAHPRAPYREIQGRFLALAGRAISRNAVRAAIKRAVSDRSAPLPSELPARVKDRSGMLTEEQRAEIRILAAAHPGLTSGQFAVVVRAKLGRKISRYTAWTFLAGRANGPGSGHLTDEHRDLLLSIVRDSAPEYCRSQIARDFAALSGRPISSHSVSVFLRSRLGLPTLAPGTNSQINRNNWGHRVGSASEDKLASAPVDRSERPGRRSRYSGGAA